MRFLFVAARFFPYWALVMALISAELGWSYRRKDHGVQYLFWGLGAVFLILSLLWFLFGGYSQSDYWVRTLFGNA